MTNPKVVVNKPRRGPKVFTVVLTTSDLVWMGAGAALALTIFFVFGLLVGRGYFPAEEGYLATEQGQVQARGQEAAQDETRSEPEVLRPEELSYPERIREEEPEAAETAQEAAGQQAGDEAPEVAGQESGDGADEAAGTAAGPEEDARPAEEAAEAAADDGPVFDYVYQVAAFKDAAMAEALKARLEDRGLEAEVRAGENSGVTWHRVRVLFTGTPPATRQLRDTVVSITKVKPVLVSKEPVAAEGAEDGTPGGDGG